MTPMDDAASVKTETTTPLSQGELDGLTDKLIEQLKTVFDPEIPVDIYELGWDPLESTCRHASLSIL